VNVFNYIAAHVADIFFVGIVKFQEGCHVALVTTSFAICAPRKQYATVCVLIATPIHRKIICSDKKTTKRKIIVKPTANFVLGKIDAVRLQRRGYVFGLFRAKSGA
jgi:hypothetical protein